MGPDLKGATGQSESQVASMSEEVVAEFSRDPDSNKKEKHIP